MTLKMYIATFAWVLLMLGYCCRRKLAWHLPLVLTGIAVDVALVLYLQFSKNAVQKAMEFSLPVLPQMHVLVSTIALLLYLPVLWIGFAVLKNRSDIAVRIRHKRLALTALFFRTLGFALMFSMLSSPTQEPSPSVQEISKVETTAAPSRK